ncbi:MAG TPA: hypothetical protein VI730_03965 [Burkholderiales bacterium]|nr:hypothetical protein [Burkholderiales bacterium]
MEIVWFTIIAIALYLLSDRLLEFIERKRGRRFEENRPFVFFAIIAPLALATFWFIRTFSGG